jgi:predicted dehydrogenase
LGVDELAACDRDPQKLSAAGAELGIRPYTEVFSALSEFKPDAVLVCTPPTLHVSQARQALGSGAHVFIEKPLSHELNDVEELITESEQNTRIVQVGYNLRFHPGLQQLKTLFDSGVIGRMLWSRAEFGQYLPDWRPSQDYRHSYTAQRKMGGGILLDASHELDYLTWLLGTPESVSCAAGKVSRLEVDVEDSATVLLHYADGSHADVHLDFVQRAYSRSCSIAGEKGTLIWDYVGQQVRLFRADQPEWEVMDYDVDTNEMYLSELRHFLSCVRDGGRLPLVGLREAASVLRIVIAARAAAESGRRMPIE